MHRKRDFFDWAQIVFDTVLWMFFGGLALVVGLVLLALHYGAR